MKISMEYVRNVCKLGQREFTCRYLGASVSGWECLKLGELKEYLDKSVEKGLMGSKGDNCKGVNNAN